MTIEQWIKENTKGFVKTEKINKAFGIGIARGVDMIVWGPGGYNKSNYFNRMLSAISGITPFVQTIAEDMDAGRLFGGIDIKKFNDPVDAAIEYNVARSWIKSEYAVLEEFLDGPPGTLASIKDALTSGYLRNGAQVEKVDTIMLIGLTNHDPQEVANMGPHVAALLERFPIQYKEEWDSHTKNDYNGLFDAVLSKQPLVMIDHKDLEMYQKTASEMDVPKKIRGALAHILGEAQTKGIQISPRTAVLCLSLIKGHAVMKGKDSVNEEDIVAIEFLPGCGDLTEGMRAEIEAATARELASSVIRDLQKKVASFFKEFDEIPKSPIKILQMVKKAQILHKEVAGTKVHETLVGQRQTLLDEISNVITRGHSDAVKYTHE